MRSRMWKQIDLLAERLGKVELQLRCRHQETKFVEYDAYFNHYWHEVCKTCGLAVRHFDSEREYLGAKRDNLIEQAGELADELVRLEAVSKYGESV